MAAITAQRDLVNTLKKETLLNIGILSKLQVMPADLSRLIFDAKALEKPTQNVFIHLSHYLVSIIDSQKSSALPWPLYDTKTERAFRNELSSFINEYSAKGLLSPVMSSYLVNPGCFKVTVLIFQLSQLAVQRMLKTKMHREHQKKLYKDKTEQYQSNKKEGFIEDIEQETDVMLSKFSNYLQKQEAMEKIAGIIRNKITTMEETLTKTNAKKYLNNIVDGFLKDRKLTDEAKAEILKVKNVNKTSTVISSWLDYVDEKLIDMESKWEVKTVPFLEICSKTLKNSKDLINRHTGEADKNSFMIEFNPKTDEINTKELQNHVNSEQRYVLKNLIRDEKLVFPNLIKGFVISLCYVLNNMEIDDNVYKFNEYLEGGKRNYEEMISAMRILNERVYNAESRLQITQSSFNLSLPSMDICEIPPLLDLSDIRTNRDQSQVLFDMFTPLSSTKHLFNLPRRQNISNFIKPQPKSLITPYHQGPSDSFLKSLISCRVSSYDGSNLSQNINSISMISHATNKGDETIAAECSARLTKQQILRLFSTKKSSSSKKFKFKKDRPNINVKKGGLFNKSNVSDEKNPLFRSYSTPNLFENKENVSYARCRDIKLSIMEEDMASLLEVSGISMLDKDSKNGTPQGCNLESTRNSCNMSSLPVMNMKPDIENRMINILHELDKNHSPLLNLESTRNSCNTSDLPVMPVVCGENDAIPNEAKSYSSPNVMASPKNPKRRSRLPVKSQVPSKMINILSEIETNLNTERKSEAFDVEPVLQERKSINNEIDKDGTPKSRPPIRKTSSIEKIINRFKKVRASTLPTENEVTEPNNCKTIQEEKENLNSTNKVFTANRVLLPDLLSPSCSILTLKSMDHMDQLCFDMDSKDTRRPRESLGTALGVDHTFLDQFDLID